MIVVYTANNFRLCRDVVCFCAISDTTMVAISREVATRMSAPNATLALQLSGHLRYLCHSEQSFMWLVNEVNNCRALFAGCIVFLHTWDRLHPTIAGKEAASSLPCIARVHASSIRPKSILVESQGTATQSVPSALVGQPYSRLRDVRDVSPNARLTQPQLIPVSSPYLPPGRDIISLAGSRAMLHGIVAASRLRRQHCANFRCSQCGAAAATLPLISIRMRPDIYEPNSAPASAQQGILKKTRPGGWWPHGLPHWEDLARHLNAARRHLRQHRAASNLTSARAVYGCGAPGNMVAGGKGGDTCYWTLASNDDLLTEELSQIVTPYMLSNVCRRKQLEWSLAAQKLLALPESERTQERPSCSHLPDFWSQCAPLKNGSEPLIASLKAVPGCVIEGVLAIAMERSGLVRRSMPHERSMTV